MKKASQQRVRKPVTAARTPQHLRPTATALAIAACFSGSLALANPTNPTVVSGIAGFAQAGNILNITNSPNAIINWGSFSIGVNELTRFLQQSVSSAVLNRVIGQDPSAILGALQSNGKVFLLNPNGIVFGAGSQVDVAGLVASTLNLSNEDFLANRMRFTDGVGAGSVVNQGSLTGGSVYLIGKAVTNDGLITSPQGEVILAAGNSVELVNPGTPNLRVEIVAPDNEARNLGTITADAGRIGIYAGLINNSGTLNASSAVAEGGRIVLKATKTALLEGGAVVSARGTTGGSVEILGNFVGLTGNASIDASGDTGGGTVLVGGDYQGKNTDVQNAFRTYVGPAAIIKADAVNSGDGGKVVIWSDDATRFYGNISARGGAQSGNGGFVEVSGKRWLDYNGLADTRAPHGVTGTLLLDPSNITIDNVDPLVTPDTGSFDGDPFYLNGTLPARISWTTIKDNLVLSNAIISTGSVASEAGNITVAADSPDLASPNRLELLADNNIFVNGKITNTDAASVVVLNAGNNIEQNASGVITAGGLLAQAGGSVLLDTAPNMVGTLAGRGDVFRFKNAQSLIIGSVGGIDGVISQSSNAVVDIKVTSGNLTVNKNVTAQGSSSGDPASVKLTASTGSITVNGPVSVSALGGGTESGGAAEVIMTAGTTIAVNASATVQAIGGDGSCCGAPGSAVVSLVAPGGITVNGAVLARGGGASSGYAGGNAAVTVESTGSSVLVDNNSMINAWAGDAAGCCSSLPAAGGTATVTITSAGATTLSNFSSVVAEGGDGAEGGTAGTGTVTVTAGGGIMVSDTIVDAYGGNGVGSFGIRQGGAATILLNATGGSIQMEGAEGTARGGGGDIGGSALTVLYAAAGGITVNDRILRSLGAFTNGTTPGAAAVILAAVGDITLSDGALLLSDGNLGIAGANVSLDNAYVSTSGSLVVGATGNLDLMNGSALTGGGNATIGVLGNVTVDNSIINGNPDVVMSVGGVINMNSGGQIAAAEPTTIYVFFPNLGSGGYFVNGVEGVVYDPLTFTGFRADGLGAILDTNLLVTYGGGLQPPTDVLITAMGESITPPEPEKDKDIFEDIKDDKKDAPVCR